MKPHLWFISLVSRIVPRRFRADWKQEWDAELLARESRLAQWKRSDRAGRWDLLRRSLGAFRDALWLQPRRLEEEFFQDLRYGTRMLRQHKTWAAVAIVSLALGIGANTAIFSVADEVLLKTLPVRNPHELALFSWSSGPRTMAGNFSPGVSIDPVTGATAGRAFSHLAFERFRAQRRALSDVFAFTVMFGQPPTNDDPDPPSAQLVSGNYYTALGVPAVAGRTITIGDDVETAAPVAMISYRCWKRRFGLDPAAVGKTVTLGATAFTIVGITPPGFSGTQDVGDSPDLSIPLSMASRVSIGPKFAARMKDQPWVWTLMIMGRLKPGASFEDARADLQDTFQAAAAEGWHLSPRSRLANQPPRDTPRLNVTAGNKGLTDARRAVSRSVLIMSLVVALVLLIVCSNLVNLLLSRAAARQKEMAVRMAMGARRGRLIRQLLTESLLLAGCGAVLGCLVAFWSKDLFLLWMTRISPSLAIEPQLSLRTLGFTSVVTLLTGILVGVAPAFAATRVDVHPVMAGATSPSGRSLVSRSLLVAQVAMSIVLLIVAGLFVRTLVNLQTADVGFNMQNLLVFKVMPRPDGPGVKDPRARVQRESRYQTAVDRLQALPGVRAATLSGYPLLAGDFAMPFIFVPGRTRPADEDATVYLQHVWDNFFETLEMPLVIGRSLTARDRLEATGRVVVNEALARKYFPDVNPIGRRIAITKDANTQSVPDSDLVEIIGVVRDAKFTTVRQPPPPTAFDSLSASSPAVFQVRTASDPHRFVAAIREALRQVDANLVAIDFRTETEQAALTFAQERHFAVLSSLFGVLALVLACIGLYGLMSYKVAIRTREIGIRMALGAQRRQVVRLVMRETFGLVIAGVALGLAAASGATRVIVSMLFGLTPTDPLTSACAIASLLAVAALAGYLPARRAARVDPMTALRYE